MWITESMSMSSRPTTPLPSPRPAFERASSPLPARETSPLPYGFSVPPDPPPSALGRPAAGGRSGSPRALREAGIALDFVPRSASSRQRSVEPPFATEARLQPGAEGCGRSAVPYESRVYDTSPHDQPLSVRSDAASASTRPTFDKGISRAEALVQPHAKKGAGVSRRLGALEQERSVGAWLDESVHRLQPPAPFAADLNFEHAAGTRREENAPHEEEPRASRALGAPRRGAMEQAGGVASFHADGICEALVRPLRGRGYQRPSARPLGESPPRAPATGSVRPARAVGEVWISEHRGGMSTANPFSQRGGGRDKGVGAEAPAHSFSSSAPFSALDGGDGGSDGGGGGGSEHAIAGGPVVHRGANPRPISNARSSSGQLHLQRKRATSAGVGRAAGIASTARGTRDPSAAAHERAAAELGSATGGALGSMLGDAPSSELGTTFQHKRFDLRGFAERQNPSERGTHVRQVWRSSHGPTSVFALPAAATSAPPAGEAVLSAEQATGQWGSPRPSRSTSASAVPARRMPAGWRPDNLEGSGAQPKPSATELADSPRARKPPPTSLHGSSAVAKLLQSPRHPARAESPSPFPRHPPRTPAGLDTGVRFYEETSGRSLVRALAEVDVDAMVALGGKGWQAARRGGGGALHSEPQGPPYPLGEDGSALKSGGSSRRRAPVASGRASAYSPRRTGRASVPGVRTPELLGHQFAVDRARAYPAYEEAYGSRAASELDEPARTGRAAVPGHLESSLLGARFAEEARVEAEAEADYYKAREAQCTPLFAQPTASSARRVTAAGYGLPSPRLDGTRAGARPAGVRSHHRRSREGTPRHFGGIERGMPLAGAAATRLREARSAYRQAVSAGGDDAPW
ncbi:hypothetical protein T492DRAFT_999161 [Pavlovales sp. CCMP2436]|nr:hypothetical protein T492DRAFT_999161 [Pavlovales sp. CCMP2436]